MNHTRPVAPVPSRLGTLEDAQNYLKCSERTIRRMIADGELAAYRIGKRMVRIDLDEVATVLKRFPTAGDAA